MVSREIYSTGLKRKVMCEVRDIIATKTKGGGSRYQVIGYYTNPETGKEHKCQSMIGAQDAATICEQLGKTLPVYQAEEATPAAFAAEASEPAESSAELLVPEPSTDPVGDGRVIGQHTGGEIVSATDAAPSLPAHDYVWAGRAEEDPYNMYGKGNDGSGNIYGRGALRRLKKAIAGDSPEEVAIPMEEGIRDQEMLEEEMEAEFSEVTESVKNVFEDSEGREVFVVDRPIKNWLSQMMDEEIRDGIVEISGSGEEFEVSFPYEFSDIVVDAIAEFQEMAEESDYDGFYDRTDFEEDIYAAQSFMDSAEEATEASRLNTPAIALITAALAVGAAWWWSNKE